MSDDAYSLGQGKVLRETDKAILFENIDDEQLWVPKSVIHDDSEVWADADDKREGELIVKQWWAEKNGHT
jgi:hypothetical protein